HAVPVDDVDARAEVEQHLVLARHDLEARNAARRGEERGRRRETVAVAPDRPRAHERASHRKGPEANAGRFANTETSVHLHPGAPRLPAPAGRTAVVAARRTSYISLAGHPLNAPPRITPCSLPLS